MQPPCSADEPTVEITAEHRALHDLMLDAVPSQHPADCTVCAAAITDQGAATVAELTQADLTAAVDAAVAAATTKLTADHAAVVADLEAKLAARDTDDKVADLEGKLTLAVAGQTAAETKLADTVAYLQAEADKVADAARLAEAKDIRVKAVEALKVLPADHIAEMADKWAAQDDPTWDATLATLAKVAPAKDTSGDPAGDHKDPGGSKLNGTTVTDAAGEVVTDAADADPLDFVLANRHAVSGMN